MTNFIGGRHGHDYPAQEYSIDAILARRHSFFNIIVIDFMIDADEYTLISDIIPFASANDATIGTLSPVRRRYRYKRPCLDGVSMKRLLTDRYIDISRLLPMVSA